MSKSTDNKAPVEDWQAFKKQKIEAAREELIWWAKLNKVQCEDIADYQIRLRRGKEKTLDIYPKFNKFHRIRDGEIRDERGKYKDLMKFVGSFFVE